MKRYSTPLLFMLFMVANSFTALAGNVSVTTQTHSAQGLQGVTANQSSNDISYQLGAAYREGDKITFTFPNGALSRNGNSFDSVINMLPVNNAVESLAIAGLTMGLLNTDSNSVTYRVTKLTLPHDNNSDVNRRLEWQNGSTLGGTFSIGRILYSSTALVNQNITVTVSSQTVAGDVLDSIGTRTATIAQTRSQFGTAVMTQKLNGVIDVSKSLNRFTPNAADTYTWSITNPDISTWLNRAVVVSTTQDLKGQPGRFTGLTNANFASSGTLSVDPNAAKVSIRFTGQTLTDTLRFTAAGDVALQAQNFNSDIIYNYTSAAAVAGSSAIAVNLDSGVWNAIGQATVDLDARANTINEAAGTSIITATMSNVSFEDVTVGLSYLGTATSGTDYITPATSIIIPAGQTQATTTITAIDDANLEASETIIVYINSVTGGVVTENGNQQRTISLIDNDTTAVSLAVNNTNIDESGGSSTLSATLAQATYQDVTVNLGLSGSATTADFSSPAATIIISAGLTVGSITWNSNNDTLVEGLETAIIDVLSVNGGNSVENGTQQQSITITDDDYSPVSVSLSVSTNSMAETAATNTITATLDAATLKDVTVNLAYTGTATNGTDYTSQSNTIVITAGQTSNTTTLTITPDTIIESDETIIVDIDSVTGANASENGTQRQTVTILDDESTTVTLSVANTDIAETGGSSTITATLPKTTFEDVTVNLELSGTATTADFTLASSTITISAGQTVGSTTLSANSDTDVEGNETVIVDVLTVSGGNATENGTQQQTLTITDDDFNPVTVTLSVSNNSVQEGSTSNVLTATLDKATGADVTVNLSYSGTATNGTDYTQPSNPIIIAAGQTSNSIPLLTMHDAIVEVDETIIIDISSVAGANASENGNQQQTVNIINNDFSPVSVSLDVNPNAIAEEAGMSTITAILDEATTENVFVYLSYSGTATKGTDYVAISNAILIEAGNIAGATTIRAKQDTEIESSETIVVDIVSITGANASENGTQQQTITITDDDFEPVLVSLSISADTMVEDQGETVVTATLDKATAADVSVYLSLLGTALNETDYLPQSILIQIKAGETSGTTKLVAIQDTDIEETETIIIEIAAVNGANASQDGVQSHTVTLIDDDFVPVLVSLQVSPDILTESGGASNITASLDQATFEDVTVNLAFSGNATNGTDYVVAAQSIVIKAGFTIGTTTIAATQDVDVEGLESVVVDINSVSGGNASEYRVQRASVTILDDDITQVSLTTDTATIWEIGGVAVVTASLNKVTYEDVAVSLVYSGTAANGTDYNALSDLTIKAGQTSGLVILTTIQDLVVEDPQSIIITVGAVSGGNAYQSGLQQSTITLFDGELDTDLDGIANSLDTDDDNDGIPDINDAFPLDSTEMADTDLDGIGNNADLDDDNDGIPDISDDFPLDATQSLFTMIDQLTVDDARFAACIEQTAATNNWTKIEEIVSLDCSSQGITDLANIERFTQLKTLKLGDNALTDIDSLTNLAQLTELDLSQNNLVQSKALAGLSALTQLNLASNTINNTNALGQLTQLKNLSLSNNLIEDVDALGGIASLDEIDLNNNRIAQVTGLLNLTQTTKISLLENNNIDCRELDTLVGTLTDSQITRPTHCVGSGTFIADVPFANDNLRQCVLEAAQKNEWTTVDEVMQLSCASLEIDDLSGLDHFVHLTALLLNNNKLTDLSPLNALIKLTYLDVRKNAVTDIRGLSRLLELTTLKLAKNNVENIQVMANFNQLTFLSLADNKVTDKQLNALAQLTQLEVLYLRDNLITDIKPLTELVNLTRLYLSRNAVSDISILAGFDQLIKVELNDNNISDISALFGLEFATLIQLIGNEDIPCVDINTLELTLDKARISRPASCINISQVQFNDQVLQTCVVEAAINNAWITANEVTRLSCVNKAVKNLDGINTFSALEFVDLGQNDIVNINALMQLRKAAQINLFGNDQINCTSLDSLASAVEGRILTRPEACLN